MVTTRWSASEQSATTEVPLADHPPIEHQSAWDWHGENWRRAERVLAVVGVLLVSTRIQVTPQLLTVGDIFAVALIPVWLPIIGRYVGARALFIIGALAIPSGLLLTLISASSHQISLGIFVTATVLMVSLLASIGFMLWARMHMTEAGLILIFGIGLLAGLRTGSDLFATNPWKFGFALPITVIVLGLLQYTRIRGLELAVVIVLCVVSAVTDARSVFAILLLTAGMFAWQLRPTLQTRPGSIVRAVLGLILLATIVYNVVQAAILSGLLGEETQERTERQINESGSLILGGRPEIAATIALMRLQPWGFGSGTQPNLAEINAAKTGMVTVGYDPNNGYVENWMFGNSYALHSMFGDLWAQYGLVGLAFTLYILYLVLHWLGRGISHKTATTALLFLSVLTLWNIFFAPFYSSMKVLILLCAIAFIRRDREQEGLPPPDSPPDSLPALTNSMPEQTRDARRGREARLGERRAVHAGQQSPPSETRSTGAAHPEAESPS